MELEYKLFNDSGMRTGRLGDFFEFIKQYGVDTEIYHIGTKPIFGCTACEKCFEEIIEGNYFYIDKTLFEYSGKVTPHGRGKLFLYVNRTVP